MTHQCLVIKLAKIRTLLFLHKEREKLVQTVEHNEEFRIDKPL